MGNGIEVRKIAGKSDWFSNRHRTSKEHDESVARYRQAHGKNARRASALARLEAKKSPSKKDLNDIEILRAKIR